MDNIRLLFCHAVQFSTFFNTQGDHTRVRWSTFDFAIFADFSHLYVEYLIGDSLTMAKITSSVPPCRPTLPTYEEATKLLPKPNAQFLVNPLHVRHGSDPMTPDNARGNHGLLRHAYTSVGCKEKELEFRNRPAMTTEVTDSSLPPKIQSAMRTSQNTMAKTHLRHLPSRAHSSLDHVPALRRTAHQPPRKPARKFPPVMENFAGNYYGSDGCFFDQHWDSGTDVNVPVNSKQGVTKKGTFMARAGGSTLSLTALPEHRNDHRVSGVFSGEWWEILKLYLMQARLDERLVYYT